MMNGLRLSNGVVLPSVGLGTYKAKGDDVKNAVRWAMEAGLQHIDTALVYKNAASIYEGLIESGKRLDQVFITSKLGPRNHGHEAAMGGCEEALEGFKTDVLDLMLVHWPGTARSHKGQGSLPSIRKETWKVLEDFYEQGRFRAIGVSNYEVSHLKELMTYATVKPMVNQIEVHPRFPNLEVRQFCKDQGIQVVAYSSFGTGDVIQNSTIVEISNRIGKSPAQVLLKWALQQEMAVLPKSVHKERIMEWTAAKMQGWELSPSDMESMAVMNDGHKYCWNPTDIP